MPNIDVGRTSAPLFAHSHWTPPQRHGLRATLQVKGWMWAQWSPIPHPLPLRHLRISWPAISVPVLPAPFFNEGLGGGSDHWMGGPGSSHTCPDVYIGASHCYWPLSYICLAFKILGQANRKPVCRLWTPGVIMEMAAFLWITIQLLCLQLGISGSAQTPPGRCYSPSSSPRRSLESESDAIWKGRCYAACVEKVGWWIHHTSRVPAIPCRCTQCVVYTLR